MLKESLRQAQRPGQGRLSGQDRAGSAARRGVPLVRKGNLPIDYSSYKRYGVRRFFVFNLAS